MPSQQICVLLQRVLPVFLTPLFVLSLSLSPAQAATSEARAQLEKTVNAVLDELDNPELKNPATRDAVLAKVEGIIQRLFDFDELSARTVGPNWKNFSNDQKKRFTEAFTTLLRESYLEKLDGYNGETVSYTGETSSKAGDKVEISTTVNIKGKPVPVAYRMLKKSHWVVYDVLIEGVSMVQNYRSQFQDLLAREDAEQLIKQVQAKALAVRANNKTQPATK